jgi:micrococcal nuclease
MKRLSTSLFALALLGSPALATDGVRVIDGDTIDLNGMPIRILGIDTPETFRPRCENERALGVAAKARLIELLDGVEVTYEASSYDLLDVP